MTKWEFLNRSQCWKLYSHSNAFTSRLIYCCPSVTRVTTNELKVRRIIAVIYRVSQEEWTTLRESVPYVELYRYNPKHLYPKWNGYGDNGHRKVWASGVSTYYTPSVTPYSSNAHAGNQTPLASIVMQWPWRDNASAAACVNYLET